MDLKSSLDIRVGSPASSERVRLCPGSKELPIRTRFKRRPANRKSIWHKYRDRGPEISSGNTPSFICPSFESPRGCCGPGASHLVKGRRAHHRADVLSDVGVSSITGTSEVMTIILDINPN